MLEVVVGGQIDRSTGYVLDLKRLAEIIERRIIQDVDHRNLNTDVPWAVQNSDPIDIDLTEALGKHFGKGSQVSDAVPGVDHCCATGLFIIPRDRTGQRPVHLECPPAVAKLPDGAAQVA